MTDSGCSAAFSRAIRRSADAEAYASRQPFLPQVQRTPSWCIDKCPNSQPPGIPPRKIFLSRITPLPTPVPSVRRTAFSAPSAAPAYTSPSAAASASLAISIPTSRCFFSSSTIGTFSQPKLLEYRITPRFASIVPGLPIPIPSHCSNVMPAFSSICCTASAMRSTSI